jgi:hypothetical protein
MSPTLKRFWRGAEEPEADNDPVTVGHKDANAIFADLKRTKSDVFSAQHAATEAADALIQAKLDHTRAWEAMTKLFQDHDLTDVPLPKQDGSDVE